MHSNKTGEVFFPRGIFFWGGDTIFIRGRQGISVVLGILRLSVDRQCTSVAFSETSIEGGPQGPNSFFSNDRAPCGDLQPRGDLVQAGQQLA